MKKNLLIATGVAALLMITGCSKQPNLENAAQAGQSTQSVNTQNMNQNGSALNGKETVNTQNANVQEQTIGEGTKITLTAKQKFAKKLANIVVYFDFDKYNIRPDQWPKVEKLAKLIESNPANYTVRIEGNCDERGTIEYNLALGEKRALAAKQYLVSKGVSPDRITIISYGKSRPLDPAHNEYAWAKNRRDHFVIISK